MVLVEQNIGYSVGRSRWWNGLLLAQRSHCIRERDQAFFLGDLETCDIGIASAVQDAGRVEFVGKGYCNRELAHCVCGFTDHGEVCGIRCVNREERESVIAGIDCEQHLRLGQSTTVVRIPHEIERCSLA